MLRYLDLEAMRLEYADYQALVKFLKIPFKPEFYQEDLFSICGLCIRYSTNNILRQFIFSLGQILRNNYTKFRTESIQRKCLKSYIKAIIRLLDKDDELESKKKELISIYDSYFESDFTPLGVSIFKHLFDELSDSSEFSKNRTAAFLINNKNIIRAGLQSMERSNNKFFNLEV